MKQVIVIHGGTVFSTYEAYLEELSTKKVSIERLKPRQIWRDTLQQSLGNKFQVLQPTMPNKTNAKYDEWERWFTNISGLFADGCVLIGHSLGAVFLAKYLSQNTLPCKVRATILVASPFNDESLESLGDFKIDVLGKNFAAQAGSLFFYNGDDDPVIPVSDVKKYKKYLPQATFVTVSAPDHFMRAEFPELTECIKGLSA